MIQPLLLGSFPSELHGSKPSDFGGSDRIDPALLQDSQATRPSFLSIRIVAGHSELAAAE
jgi:hypothetical protein